MGGVPQLFGQFDDFGRANLMILAALFEFLYKFFDKVAILGPACGGVQAICPVT